MTVPTDSNKAGPFATNGATTVFPFPFPITAAGDLRVYRRDTTTAQEVLLTLTTDYSVAFTLGVSGGSITSTTVLPSGYEVTILREVELTQELDLDNSGGWFPDAHEAAYDKLTMAAQQLDERVGRALRVPASFGGIAELPSPRAGYLLGSTDGESFSNVEFVDPSAAIAGNWTVDRFVAGVGFTSGVSTSLTLTKSPASAQSILVSFDGEVQGITSYGVAGSSLSFYTPIAASVVEVRIPATLPSGVPGDGTVAAALVVASGGTAARTVGSRFADVINVKDYGAKGDFSTDDTAAIQAAFNAVNADTAYESVVHFPPGLYRITSGISLSGRNVTVMGYGARIRPSTNGAYYCLTLSNGVFTICGLEIIEYGALDLVGGISLANGDGSVIKDTVIDIGATSAQITSCRNIRVTDNRWRSWTGRTFYANGISGSIQGNGMACVTDATWGGFGRGEKGACFTLVGNPTTTLQVTNNVFTGGGASWKVPAASINSTPTYFIVTTAAAIPLRGGDHLVIEGCSVAAYNGTWKIDSVVGSAAYVLSTLNPGLVNSSGTVSSLRPCLLVDGTQGAVNETSWTGNIFEGWQTASMLGSVSVMLNGSGGAAEYACYNHTFTGNWLDFGQTGYHIQGQKWAGDHTTVNGIVINGGYIQYALRALYVQSASQITFSGVQCAANMPFAAASDAPRSSAVLLDGYGLGTHKSNGIIITGCHLGTYFGWIETNRPSYTPAYGVWVDGTLVDDVTITGCQIYGRTAPIYRTNGGAGAGWLGKVQGNTYWTGALPLPSSQQIPTVASATAITLPWHDHVRITGSTNISTINGGWVGREVTLLFDVASTANFVTGGNILVAATAGPGRTSKIVFDGTDWYVR